MALSKLQWGFLIPTVIIVIVIVIVDIFMWSKRTGLYTFKAKPAPSGTSTKGGFLTPKATVYNTVYYPNGEPDPNTGKPANYSTLPTGIATSITNNLNLYAASGTLQSGLEWGPNNA